MHQFPHQRANGHHFRFTPQSHLIVNITHSLIVDFSAPGGHVKLRSQLRGADFRNPRSVISTWLDILLFSRKVVSEMLKSETVLNRFLIIHFLAK